MNDWEKATIQKIWEKATEVKDVDRNLWRKDLAGAWISRKHYANEYSQYGWEIDIIKPISGAGKQYSIVDISNLQPLQWNNKLSKADDYPIFSTTMIANIGVNIEKKQYWNCDIQVVSTDKKKYRKILKCVFPCLLQA